jgi:choline dehydrogenase
VSAPTSEEFDYVVVGSGAGGGPVAANLAEAGHRVLLLEAGLDPEDDDYRVPAFHGRASEHPEMSWNFYVRHWDDDAQQERDRNYQDGKGVLYPRSATLGGCTAHNAMITIYPHDVDWDGIADLTGDASWRSTAMRQWFEKLEACDYLERPRALPSNPWVRELAARLPIVSDRYVNKGRHGFDGWLHTTMADPKLAIQDEGILDVLLRATKTSLGDLFGRPLNPIELLDTYYDPNDWRVRGKPDGIWRIPIAVRSGRRNSTRERVLDVSRRYPDRLVVRTGALVTRVLLEGDDNVAAGVEYLPQPHAYRADPTPTAEPQPDPVRVRARREVIVSGGAFNTPQLLKLSGVGPRDELERFGIPVKVDLPGVGENLQDRYEVGVVSKMRRPFGLTEGLTFAPPPADARPDRAYVEWENGRGVYASNGALVGIVERSRDDLATPDLFVFGLPAHFTGYAPGYSKQLLQQTDVFTWAVLKAHTHNRAGRVLLRSADPRDVPDIRFRYFDEGDDVDGEDLAAVVAGVKYARSIMAELGDDVLEELCPGADVRTDEELAAFVRDDAWGHHASCTAAMGPRSDPRAVVDSRFRVHGTRGLRVVDASIFPRIPGFFIVTAVYMAAEKASAVILADAERNGTGPLSALRHTAALLPEALIRPFRRPGDAMSTETDSNIRSVPEQRTVSNGHPSSASVPATPQVPGAGYRATWFWRVYDGLAQAVDHTKGWDKLPLAGGLAVLIGVRTILRQKNLFDPSTVVPLENGPTAPPRTQEHLVSRSVDGSYNDLDLPTMGMAGARFGRNIPLDQVLPVTRDELMEPNPREISRRLLTRSPFLPATSVNTLAAAWLQFMIHDWFTHGTGDTSRLVDIPIPPGDEWYENPMRIPRIKNDPSRPADAEGPVTTINDVTHWWDGSSLYGSSLEEQRMARSGQDGKLRLTDDGQLPIPDDPALDFTMRSGSWTGMSMLITLFVREHNAVCDRLKAEYPHWDDEELFQRARLVVAALMAKIHTAEWTPAIISHPTTVYALRANWFGVAGERIARAFGRISDSEVISGIPGAATEHYGVPFSLTEEFTSVYRMHPLLPDDFDLRSVDGDRPLLQCTFRDLAGPHFKEVRQRYAMGDLFYSFGTTHPGAIVLRNYPKFLQAYERPDGKVIDVATTDIVRIRELGVPRYCEFRRQLHLRAPASFAELTDDAGLAKDMADIYGDVERVDLMVGLFAEKRPEGFAFSDTAFRIFILMASRRLNSDRFFTKDFRPEIYSPAGLQWVRDNDMRTVLLRHFPELRPALRGLDNAFAPWTRTA